MDFIKALKTSLSGNNVNKKVFSALAVILAILALFLVGTVLFPAVVSAIFNILWIVLIAVVIVFFVLGILVILGMRKEVSQFLDILLEGSLTIIDFLHFLRDLWKRFIALLKEFLVYAAPVFSYIFTFIIYIVLMYIYKTIGSHSDVTLLTVILTLTLIIAFGIVNKPKINQTEPVDWKDFFKQRFRSREIQVNYTGETCRQKKLQRRQGRSHAVHHVYDYFVYCVFILPAVKAVNIGRSKCRQLNFGHVYKVTSDESEK